MRPFILQSVHPPIHQLINLSINPSIHPSAVAALHQGKCHGRNTSALAAALAVKSEIVYQDINCPCCCD